MMTQLTITGRSSTRRCSSRPGSRCPADEPTGTTWAEAARTGRRGDRHALPDGDRPLRPPLRRPGDQHGRQVLRRRGQARRGRRRLQGDGRASSSTGTRTARCRRTSGAAGGAAYRDAFEEFTNGNVVFYFSGTWQVERMERRSAKPSTGVVGVPCGPGGCTGMPGGAASSASSAPSTPRRSPSSSTSSRARTSTPN